MSYTKGPWRYDTRKIKSCPKCNPNAGSISYVKEKSGDEICTIYSQKNQEANARLIAAAPDLLEACKEALKFAKAITQLTNFPDAKQYAEVNESILEQAIAKSEAVQ